MVKAKWLLALGVLLFAAPTAQAGFVWQAPGDDYIAFEAESFESIDDLDGDGDVWDPRAEAAASGGTYLHAVDSSGNTPDESEAVYRLQFTTAGAYRLYVRHRSTDANTASQDSFYRPSDFDQPATTTAYTNDDDNAYRWGYFGTYTVSDPDDLTDPLGFRLGIREGNFRLDRVVLTTTNYGSSGFIPMSAAGDLESLGNSALVPEPTAVILLFIGGLGLLVTSRRRFKA